MMNRSLIKWAFFASILISTGTFARSQEWTRFRGPNGTGISETKTVPIKWDEDHFLWKTELPGGGHSSPVLWGNKLFVTGSPGNASKHQIYCLDATTGKLLWTREFPYHVFQKHQFNSFASPTPAVDSERLYACWSIPEHYQLAALDHDGEIVWTKDLGPFVSQHGCGTSPIVYNDLVVLANDQMNGGNSYLIAVNRETGETVWKTPRGSSMAAYSTPCVYPAADGGELLIFNSDAEGIVAINPRSGRPVWAFKDAFDKRSVSSPVFANGLVFGSCGSGGGGDYVIAIKAPTREGEQPELAYKIRRNTPYVPTGVIYHDRIFLWDDSSFLTCADLSTGRTIWQERIDGRFFGSPVCVNGNLYCVSDTGEVVVVEASDNFTLLARNPLGEFSHSTPAIANGRMYLRTFTHVICVGVEPLKTRL